MKPKLGMRWAIYSRISGSQGAKIGDDDDDTASLETQEDGCRDMVARLDPTGAVDETLVFREVHTGVELFTRPALTRLREAMRQGRVDAVACYQPKRWARDPDHAGYLRTEMREHRVLLRFAIDDPGDDEAGALVGYVHHWAGKQEHKSITEQTHRARAKLVKMGQPWGGCKAPYGLRVRYATVAGHGSRVQRRSTGWDIEPAEARELVKMFEAALRGASMRGIARDLMERSVPSPKGGKGWSGTVIRQLLEGRIYTGEAHGLRYKLDHDDRYLGKKGQSAGRWKARVTVKPEDEWERLPEGTAPQIIDEVTFAAVQRRLAGLKRGGKRPSDPTLTLMSDGRARCGACGRAMTMWSTSPPVLVCGGRTAPEPCPSKTAIRAPLLDRAVRELARTVYTHPEVILEQAEMHRASDPTAADLAVVEATLADVLRAQENIARVAGMIVDAEAAAPLVAQLTRLAEQKQAAERDRARLLEQRAGWEESRRFLAGFVETAAGVAAKLDGFGHAEWQKAVDALGINAVVRPVGKGWMKTGNVERYTLSLEFDGTVTAGAVERMGLMQLTGPTSLHEAHHAQSLTLSWHASQLAALLARLAQRPAQATATTSTPRATTAAARPPSIAAAG
jgi:DNA invertase Pin-like site-specific DNA recombinase